MGGLASTVRDLAVRTPESRERSADMWRALAICLVVLGHWFVIAVAYQDGELSGYNALDVLTWIDPVTWLFQVMPIFFLVGGYASAASLASHRASGGDGIGWVLRRTDRLLRPTTALLVVLPLATVVTVAAGVDRGCSVPRPGLPPCRCGSCWPTSPWWCSRRGCTRCTAGRG